MDIIYASLISDLKKAIDQKTHPFRYFTMATVDPGGTPRLRTMVLRNVDEQLNLTVYTDRRSEKVQHLQNSDTVSLLFYDTARLLQITMHAKASMITDDRVLNTIWNTITPKARKDYTTELPPGKEIKDPSTIEYLDHKNYFLAVDLIPEQIEYLRLKRPNHIRALFRKQGTNWKGSFLVP
ncbi:pyridoxamine 5'-phosphate oxidase family protein [Ascidiimonas aurantiaca]|uniref:pyridoxamine 5'-phosphate oxidase family protein n=1 Tax=Ascidiimonas aurantiaca TaxID=1685432 RepID=UPI0030EBAE3F